METAKETYMDGYLDGYLDGYNYATELKNEPVYDSDFVIVGDMHPYTNLLIYSIENDVWRQYKQSDLKRYRQIHYTEIVKVLKHLVQGDVDLIGGVSVNKVKNYFKIRNYLTATTSRVSVDELEERLMCYGNGSEY